MLLRGVVAHARHPRDLWKITTTSATAPMCYQTPLRRGLWCVGTGIGLVVPRILRCRHLNARFTIRLAARDWTVRAARKQITVCTTLVLYLALSGADTIVGPLRCKAAPLQCVQEFETTLAIALHIAMVAIIVIFASAAATITGGTQAHVSVRLHEQKPLYLLHYITLSMIG